jgi:hypothetical protein
MMGYKRTIVKRESEFMDHHFGVIHTDSHPRMNRIWSKQKENTRLVVVKRAQVYHSGRIYMHALYRRRSALDDELLADLVELCLSPYTRVRRYVGCIDCNKIYLTGGL